MALVITEWGLIQERPLPEAPHLLAGCAKLINARGCDIAYRNYKLCVAVDDEGRFKTDKLHNELASMMTGQYLVGDAVLLKIIDVESEDGIIEKDLAPVESMDEFYELVDSHLR